MKTFVAIQWTQRLDQKLLFSLKGDKIYPGEKCIWNTETKRGTWSSAGCLQHFSNKTQTSLKFGSISFNSLYVTLLNYSEEQWRLQILSGITVSAYFPVSF